MYSRMLLHALVLSIVLLPIRFHFFKYVILILISLVSANALRSCAFKLKFPYSSVYLSIAIFTLVFSFWALLSLVYQNHLNYIFEDSAGFLVYLIFPVLFAYVATNDLSSSLVESIILAAVVVTVIDVGVFISFYAVFGSLTFDNLLAVNTALASFGFTWDLGASGGILRADTKAGHYLLLGMALLFCKFVTTKKPAYLILIGVLFIGALLDGHRALIGAVGIFAALILPIVIRTMELYPLRFLTPLYVIVGLVIVTFILFIDTQGWWDRFTAFESPSLDMRVSQVAALVEEIAERPLLGNGFGSYAAVIRSEDRPYMYEMDFLAVTMKLGVLGAALYFSTYFWTIALVLTRKRSVYGYVIFSVGLSYFFYMGTNGGFAMSPISSFFHVLLFLCISAGLAEERFLGNVVGVDVLAAGWRASLKTSIQL